MDEAAERVPPLDLAGSWSWRRFSRVGWPKLKGAVRPLGVVVIDINTKDVFEVAPVEDQEPVETLRADRSHEAFRDRVRLWRAHWRLDDPDALASEDVVERAGVLAVPVTDQETCSLEEADEAQVACLLGDPVRIRVGRAASEPDPAGAVLDENST